MDAKKLFGTTDLYEILGVARDANINQSMNQKYFIF